VSKVKHILHRVHGEDSKHIYVLVTIHSAKVITAHTFSENEKNN